MIKILFSFIILLSCKNSYSQNLVPNGSFEQYSTCPSNFSEIPYAIPWTVPTSFCSTDYYNQCSTNANLGVPINVSGFGYQFAHTGKGYSGIYLFHSSSEIREYLEVPLNSSLIANNDYRFEMYVNLFNGCRFTTSSIGAYLSDTLISGLFISSSLPYSPQIINLVGNDFDTLNWIQVNGSYHAHGGESYMVIGNFNSDSNTNISQINSTGFEFAYVYIDDICLCSQENSCLLSTGEPDVISNQNIEIFPNPFLDKLNFTGMNDEEFQVIIYDLTSREILRFQFKNLISINTNFLTNGLYLYEVRNKNGIVKKGKVLKSMR